MLMFGGDLNHLEVLEHDIALKRPIVLIQVSFFQFSL